MYSTITPGTGSWDSISALFMNTSDFSEIQQSYSKKGDLIYHSLTRDEVNAEFSNLDVFRLFALKSPLEMKGKKLPDIAELRRMLQNYIDSGQRLGEDYHYKGDQHSYSSKTWDSISGSFRENYGRRHIDCCMEKLIHLLHKKRLPEMFEIIQDTLPGKRQSTIDGNHDEFVNTMYRNSLRKDGNSNPWYHANKCSPAFEPNEHVKSSIIDYMGAILAKCFTDGDDPWPEATIMYDNGLVPVYDGKHWRLYHGEDAEVVFEVGRETLYPTWVNKNYPAPLPPDKPKRLKPIPMAFMSPFRIPEDSFRNGTTKAQTYGSSWISFVNNRLEYPRCFCIMGGKVKYGKKSSKLIDMYLSSKEPILLAEADGGWGRYDEGYKRSKEVFMCIVTEDFTIELPITEWYFAGRDHKEDESIQIDGYYAIRNIPGGRKKKKTIYIQSVYDKKWEQYSYINRKADKKHPTYYNPPLSFNQVIASLSSCGCDLPIMLDRAGSITDKRHKAGIIGLIKLLSEHTTCNNNCSNGRADVFLAYQNFTSDEKAMNALYRFMREYPVQIRHKLSKSPRILKQEAVAKAKHEKWKKENPPRTRPLPWFEQSGPMPWEAYGCNI